MANLHEKRFFEKMSTDIKEMFFKLQDALKNRETQLLRQIEVLSQHCQLTESYDKYSKEISLVFDNTNDIFQSIANLGKINLSGLHCTSEVFQIEDYQKLEIDHDSFNKYIEKSEVFNKTESNEKVIETNENHKIESINSAMKSNSVLECIGKDDPKLCQHNAIKITHINSDNSHKGNYIKKEQTINYNSECQCNCFITNIPSKCVCNSNMEECINCNDFIDDKIKKISLQQPIPIQHWMNNIILETELEPTSNNIMEHSQIEEK